MSDITERLRHEAAHPDYMARDEINWCNVRDTTLTEAADEIKRLRAALRECLGQMEATFADAYRLTDSVNSMNAFCVTMQEARAALGDQP